MNSFTSGFLVGKFLTDTATKLHYRDRDYVVGDFRVDRDFSDNVDVVPLLMSEKIYSQILQAKGIVAVLGNVKSLRQQTGTSTTKRSKPYFSVEAVDKHISKYSKQNTITLAGQIAKQPWQVSLANGKNLTYFTLHLQYPNTGYVNCFVREGIAKYVQPLTPGDTVKFSGRLYTRAIKTDMQTERYDDNGDIIRPRACEVMVNNLKSVERK